MALSPGWTLGYTPTPAEWNGLWASKLDAITFPSVLSVKDAGAAGNGTTDDTQAFRRAIASLPNARGVVLVPSPPVAYLLSGTITVPSRVSIVGSLGGSAIRTASGSYTLFSITGQFITVRNLRIDDTNKSGGADISIDCGSTVPGSGPGHIIIENIAALNSYGVFSDSGSGQALYQDCTVRGVWSSQTRGIGLVSTRIFGSLFLDRCTIDYAGSTNPNCTGIAIDNSVLVNAGVGAVGGVWMKNCVCSQGANGYSVANTVAFWADNCQAVSNSNFGWLFSNVQNAYLSRINSVSSGNANVWFVNCSNCTITSPSIAGGSGSGIVFASGNAFITVANPYIKSCSGDGISVAGTQAACINLSGGIMNANGGLGLRFVGGSSVLATKMTLAGNASGNFNINGSLHHIRGIQVNSGAVVDADGPAAL